MSAGVHEDAEQSSNGLALDEAGPPAYALHTNNEPYETEASQVRGTVQSCNENASQTRIPANLIPNIVDDCLAAPLSLTMDGDLIYPTSPPSSAVYHLPSQFTWSSNQVSVNSSVPARMRNNGRVVPVSSRDLYLITKPFWAVLSGSDHYVLERKRASCFGAGKAVMKRPKKFRGIWQVSFSKKLAMSYKNGEWRDAEDHLLATLEKGTKDTGLPEEKKMRVMVIEKGVHYKMVNLLVACWMVQVWRKVRAQIKKKEGSRLMQALKTGSRLKAGAL